MRLKMILAAALLSALFGCTSMMGSVMGLKQDDKAYKITAATAGENRAMVSFRGRAYLIEAEDKKANTEMRQPNYEGFPALGYLYIMINGRTIDSGNPKNCLYIIKDNTGQEVYRGNGRDATPNPDTTQYGTNWEGYDIIPFDDTLVKFPLTIRIVNQISNYVMDFTISKTSSK